LLYFSAETELTKLSSSFDLVTTILDGLVDEEIRPGISANIVYKNKLIWEGNFGQISKTNTTKPTGDTIYRYSSLKCSKTKDGTS